LRKGRRKATFSHSWRLVEKHLYQTALRMIYAGGS